MIYPEVANPTPFRPRMEPKPRPAPFIRFFWQEKTTIRVNSLSNISPQFFFINFTGAVFGEGCLEFEIVGYLKMRQMFF